MLWVVMHDHQGATNNGVLCICVLILIESMSWLVCSPIRLMFSLALAAVRVMDVNAAGVARAGVTWFEHLYPSGQ